MSLPGARDPAGLGCGGTSGSGTPGSGCAEGQTGIEQTRVEGEESLSGHFQLVLGCSWLTLMGYECIKSKAEMDYNVMHGSRNWKPY